MTDYHILSLSLLALLALALGGGLIWVGHLWRRAEGRREAAEKALEVEKVRHLEPEAREKQLTNFSDKLLGQLKQSFQDKAQESVDRGQKQLLSSANQNFDTHKEELKGLVKPLDEKLDLYRKELGDFEKAWSEGRGEISALIKGLLAEQGKVQTAALSLDAALRGSPTTRGNWGQQSLRNILELAGMSAHSDFTEQPSLSREGGRLRPDVIVKLPKEGRLAIDAKAPLEHYQKAFEATEEKAREAHLKSHAQGLRAMIKELARKDYSRELQPAPDFVILYLPGEHFLAAALINDPQLFDDALKQKVLLTAPTTLLALCRCFALGWQQVKMDENAQDVLKQGHGLVERLSKVLEYIGKLGGSLEGATRNYNDLIGSIESRLRPQARRFTELGGLDWEKSLEKTWPKPIETSLRALSDKPLLEGKEPDDDSVEEKL